MDYIHIDNLRFNGKHGVYDNERRGEQEFLVSLKIGFNTKKAGKSDNLNDTLDYQEAKNAVADVISGESHYLVERLAEDIAQAILEDTRIVSVEVTIKKTAVWDNGVPGVTIVRSNI